MTDLPRLVPELANSGRGGAAVPPRRPGSIRRTTSIDLHWPDGRDKPAHFDARVRDAITLEDGSFQEIDAHAIKGRSGLSREISIISAIPDDGFAPALEGLRAGGQLRAKLRELFTTPEQQACGLYLLLDDLAGATLVSSWSWFAWHGYSEALGNTIRGANIGGQNGSMRGVCIGLAEGSSALDAHDFPKLEEQYYAVVPSLVRSDDPASWHALPTLAGPAMRRARWIDVHRHDAELIAEAGFQDSALRPDGARLAVHEYRVSAAAEAHSGRILDITATPYVLPHEDCPAAVLNLGRLKGESLNTLRVTVPEMLARTEGCTHLNDVVRALAGVQHMAKLLER